MVPMGSDTDTLQVNVIMVTKCTDKIKYDFINVKCFIYLFQRLHATGAMAYHGPNGYWTRIH